MLSVPFTDWVIGAGGADGGADGAAAAWPEAWLLAGWRSQNFQLGREDDPLPLLDAVDVAETVMNRSP
jgi:hypothetical protein